jgi:hypothetical protein
VLWLLPNFASSKKIFRGLVTNQTYFIDSIPGSTGNGERNNTQLWDHIRSSLTAPKVPFILSENSLKNILFKKNRNQRGIYRLTSEAAYKEVYLGIVAL